MTRHGEYNNELGQDSFSKLFDLSGKTAIVTGGLGILGRRFGAALAAHGAQVAIADLDEDEADGFARELEQNYGPVCIGVGCDVSDPDSVARMTDKVAEELGGIDILLNNAASKSDDLEQFFSPFETYSLAQWKKVMSVNVDGMFLAAQAVGNRMLKQNRGGSMIQMSSIYGLLGPDERIYEGSRYLGTAINTPAVYSASKAAVVGLTNHLAARWAPFGIRVNTLTPGGVESGQNSQFVERYSARVPLGRMGQPDELAGAAIYLASDASSYVTGHNLYVDGGLHAW
ncbi:SDR family NAD(P)-dependent oxidoreductase [Paenibacillus sp. GCM10012307]|uniref:SDR family oxidoreductase n=1 Tax=Paenibacillus roseus TaxID=2798579 RepID=A0A934MNL7_9BACL|nr:SDR family oxidoreductase [Paenibacillus roseus]MBJ6359978.1 SDR family oxidoreductase [Paenibacillus roseus]